MKENNPVLNHLTGIIILLFLGGCNLPKSEAILTATHSATNSFQTAEANLTQAAVANPSITTTSVPYPTSATPFDTLTPSLSSSTATIIVTTECDRAAAGIPIDVSIPDDTTMQPGQAFTKIWRLQNAGTCTWTTSYSIALFSGESMGAPASVPLPNNVQPGQSIDISVELSAPLVPGAYQGNWKLRNAANSWFGIGPDGSSAFWVRIVVVQPPTVTPTITPTAPSTPPPAVQANGTKTLIPTDRLNLDNNLINSGSGEDFVYDIGPNGQLAIIPLGSAAFGVFGAIQPSISNCQKAQLGQTPMVIASLQQEIFICYRTDLGLPGWMQLMSHSIIDLQITIQFLTWAAP